MGRFHREGGLNSVGQIYRLAANRERKSKILTLLLSTLEQSNRDVRGKYVTFLLDWPPIDSKPLKLARSIRPISLKSRKQDPLFWGP